MFRKPAKKRAQIQVRQRGEDDLSGDDDGTDVVKDFKRRKRANPFQQSTLKSKNDANKANSSSDSDEASTVLAEDAFAASGSAEPLGPRDQGATATHNIDTDIEVDAQAQFERVQQQLKEGLVKDGKTLYKGQAMYGAKEAKDTAKGNASSGLNRIGPIRAPQFVRQTVRWDYAPDICKDYKETGFCTFGDSCKFLHDRSDYKHGWEIERDYEAGKLNQIDETNYEINENDDEFPEECYICMKPFTAPVVTRCKHYFCEACALSAFRKSKRCRICNENTGGVFNIAKDLIAKLNGTAKSKKEQQSESDADSSDHEHDKHGHSHGGHACCSNNEVKQEIKTEEEDEHAEEEHGGDEIKQEEIDHFEQGDEVDHDDYEHDIDEHEHEHDEHEEVQESIEIKMEEIEEDDEHNEDDGIDDEEDVQTDSEDEQNVENETKE